MKIESLKFEGLNFSYEGQEYPLFENVDFDFPMNNLIWVKATHGSGRSSLLQILAGLQMPSKGKYLINDENVSEMSFEEFLPFRKQIGYAFDFGGLINNLSLLDNVTLPLLYHKTLSPEAARDRAVEYFTELDAKKYLNMRPAMVPGGMRKLTCLIRALIVHPQLLLLDDPSVGVSQETILKYFDIIMKLRTKGICSHVLINSFDDKMMNCLDHKEIFVDGGFIYQDLGEIQKKVVSL